jgi:ferredoxin
VNGTVIETPAWPGTYGDEARPRVGFFTDTSVCIGCKACEVACKEWNDVPAESLGFTGESYDNSGDLGANRWRHVAFIEQKLPVDGVAEAAPDSWVQEASRQQLVELRRLQALHRGRVPRRLSHRVAVPDGVRDRRRPGGHLQRLRLLRGGVPVRGTRSAQGRREGLEVHALLRPPPR